MNTKLVAGAVAAGALLVGATVLTTQLINTSTTQPTPCIQCDLNGSGSVTLADVSILLDHVGEVFPTATITPLVDTGRYLTPQEAVQALYEGAVDIGTPGVDTASGHGRLDACAAFNAAATITANPIYICATPTP